MDLSDQVPPLYEAYYEIIENGHFTLCTSRSHGVSDPVDLPAKYGGRTSYPSGWTAFEQSCVRLLGVGLRPRRDVTAGLLVLVLPLPYKGNKRELWQSGNP